MRSFLECSLLGFILLPACASDRVRVPQNAPDAPSGPEVTVTHPPPAALPEIVPETPQKDARWLDGYWIFRGKNWVWIRGGWVEVPPKVQLVPSRFWIEEGGVLHFSERRWINAEGQTVESPTILKPAATPPNPTLPEDSTLP